MSSNKPAVPAGLQTFQEREAVLLAAYAMHSADSAGRQHAEPEHTYRGPFQRDRDRILHCSAYRRLSGKMQVFTGEMGDYHRTRLTHTHEVASIARTMARALRLNEDLVEALALLHDIGHPPFGHAGEDVLDEFLRDQGGFSHNRHALTIAEELEVRYHRFPGLNLTQEVLEGQAVRADKQNPQRAPLLEVQVVDAADSITYDAHDADDAVKLGLVSLDELSEVPLIREVISRVQDRFTDLAPGIERQLVVHELIDHQVSHVLRHCAEHLSAARPATAEEARRAAFRVGPGAAVAAQKRQLESFLYERVYRHPQLVQVRTAAQQRLRAMVDGFCRQPDLLPERFQRRSGQVGRERSIVEYIAGMTDRYCNEQYEKHFSGGGSPPC